MAWQEIHIATTQEYANELSDQLSALGAVAVTFQDAGNQPIFEPQKETVVLWPETIVIGLFEAEASLSPVISLLETEEAQGKIKHFHRKSLDDENWERKCLEGFTPIPCGSRLWICPSWQTPPDPNAVNVILDPGLAFGTGTHPTTQLCLQWLDQHMEPASYVIDYGCGSGILAIAAVKLGAQKVIAVDNDPFALEATRENAERNDITGNRLLSQNPNEPLAPEADLLMANILANPLINLYSCFLNAIKPGGKIVLSGILIDQMEKVLTVYKNGFVIEKPILSSEWVLLHGTRKAILPG